MTFQALSDATNIARAYSIFAEMMMQGGEQLERRVGYQGASENVVLYWHSGAGIWVLLESDRLQSRYWCAYGVDNPHPASMLSITCEINSPRNGINRKCAGLFAQDKTGFTYLAHSGKVGGGRPGIGKSAFLDYWGSRNVVSVRFPNRQEHNYILIGRVDDSDILAAVARFVRHVARFKEIAVEGHLE